MELFYFFVFLFSGIASVSLGCPHFHGAFIDSYFRSRDATCGEYEEKYRTIDGQCNNLESPNVGRAGSAFLRFLPAEYPDGVSNPRITGVDGNPLPSPREVSLKCHKPCDARANVTLHLMQWGQFLDHDITQVLFASVPMGMSCSCTFNHPNCTQIPLVNDPYFFDRTCMPVLRSARTVSSDGQSEEQTNVLTPYIDASNVYGSSEQELMMLKGTKGELKFNECNGETFLPPRQNSSDYCSGNILFNAGDTRVNVQPALSSMHVIWMREHNRIAAHLRNRHGAWDDERVFEETRRIIGAMMQVITYHEFLPIVIGEGLMNQLGLTATSKYSYDPSKRPDMYNSFSAAAYRFGHSLVPEGFTAGSEVLPLKTLWFKPEMTLKHMDAITQGLQSDNMMALDRHVSYSLTRHLFQTAERNGFDLVARNIMRGRDHNIPPYARFRSLVGQLPITLEQLFPDDAECQSIYKHIDDVDLFTGGLSEPPLYGALVGPVFASIIGRQFKQLRMADRFFYLNPEGAQAFTPEQIANLNEVKLSKVVCLNTANKEVPAEIFKPVNSLTNPLMDCDRIPGLNLEIF